MFLHSLQILTETLIPKLLFVDLTFERQLDNEVMRVELQEYIINVSHWFYFIFLDKISLCSPKWLGTLCGSSLQLAAAGGHIITSLVVK